MSGITVGNVNNVIPFPGTHGTTPLVPGKQGLAGVAQQLRSRINAIRNSKLQKADKVRDIFNYIDAQEIQWGGQAIVAEGQAYRFDGLEKRLYRVDMKDVGFRSFLAVRYGLLATEEFTRDVVSAMEAFTIKYGVVRELKRFSFWNKQTQTLYISQYNGQAWKIDGGLVITVDNGDGCLFIDDDGGRPCQGVMVGAHDMIFPRLINPMDPATGWGMHYATTTPGGMTVDDQRCLFAVWMFSIAFNELLPGKPLLLIEGQMGSGKTTCIQIVQYSLFGESLPMQITQGSEADFPIMLSKTVIALIDNTDTPIDWVKDAVATYSTGGGWKRRELYTNTGQITIKPSAFIALATMNPETFRRSDIADRIFMLRLARRDEKTFKVGISDMQDQTALDRPWILGEYLYYLNEIVGRMRQGAPEIPQHGQRMVDFANLACTIGAVLGFDAEHMLHMFNSMDMERHALLLEGDTIVDVLDKWLDNTRNVGRPVPLLDLFSELSTVASKHKLRFFKAAKTLSRQLRDKAQSLAEHFKIATKEVGGVSIYEIRRAPASNQNTGIVINMGPGPVPAAVDGAVPPAEQATTKLAPASSAPVAKATGPMPPRPQVEGWEDALRRGLKLGKPPSDDK